MRKVVSFLVGLLAGAAVGTIGGLLLAPYAGPELQERVRTRVRDLIEEGQRAAAARRVQLESELDAFRRGAPVAIGTGVEEPEA